MARNNPITGQFRSPSQRTKAGAIAYAPPNTAKRLPSDVPAALRTVERVVEVLELIGQRRGGVAGSDIASSLGMPVSSAHALARRLLELDCLRRRNDNRKYDIGPRLTRLGVKITAGLDVVAVARPFIAELAAAIDEDVYLALADEHGITYVDRVESSRSLRLSITLGEPRSLHASAVGKLYLGMLPMRQLREHLEAIHLDKFTPHTVTDKFRLARELATIRKNRYAVTNEEHIEGVAAVAAPIYDNVGQFMAAITVALPRARFHSDLKTRIVSVADQVSEQLGWSTVPPNGKHQP
jgi:DNA-binding IclR family transcriptional regulator